MIELDKFENRKKNLVREEKKEKTKRRTLFYRQKHISFDDHILIASILRNYCMNNLK